MRFTIWGEVGALGIDGPVVLSGRLRQLLAALLSGRNAEVSRNDLIAIVWGDESEPVNAEASLRQYVSRLRRALAASEANADQLITTTPAGYRLDVDRSWVDGDVLIDAVSSGIRPDDLELMTSGEPYGSYCDEWWCLAEVERQRDLAREGRALQPAASLEPLRRALRKPTTSFVGRGQELAEVVSAVRVHRLVTLTGVGGVGKTRLALEVARQLEGDFPGGTWLVELAGVGDPAGVPGAVATELNVSQSPEYSLTECIALTLSDRRCLVLLDNCEHVLDVAADLVQAVIDSGTGPRIIATSREALRVAGEHVWSVPTLAATDGIESPAAELFVERARAIDNTFSLSSENDATAVAEICRRLDGIPLAIELAAARMLAMTPVEVRDRLDDRFRLLAGGQRGVDRHQTLRHALQWSFELLSPEESDVLERCAVFAGTFDLAAATEIAGPGQFDEYQLLDHLESLIRKSLLVVDRSIDGGTRYALLETVRQFAEERLNAAGHAKQFRDQHSQYFAREADRVASARETSQSLAIQTWYGTEGANLRAAFRWAADEGDIDTAAAIAGKTAGPAAYSQFLEPVEWCEELLEAANAQHHPLLAYLYSGAAMCCYIGRAEDSRHYAESGWALQGDPTYEPVLHGYDVASLLVGYVFSGQPEKWITLAREHRDHPDDTSRRFLTGLVWTLAATGQYDEAISLADDMLAAVRATGSLPSITFALLAYGKAFTLADPPTAIAYHRQAVQHARGRGALLFEMINRLELGGLEAKHGDPLEALDTLEDIINAFDEIGSPGNIGTAFGYLATLLLRMNLYDEASTLIGAASRHPLATVSAAGLTEPRHELASHVGEEHHEQFFSVGLAMNLEQATTYASERIQSARQRLAKA